MAKIRAIKKKYLPPLKAFDRISSLNSKVIRNTVPKSQQSRAVRIASVLEKSNVVKTSAYGINEGAAAGSGTGRREALRRYHFNTFEPGNRTSKDLRQSEDMLKSEDPEVRARGQALQDQANAKTKRQGRLGLAVAAVSIGGVAGSAVSGGLKATADGNPQGQPLDADGYAYEDYAGGAGSRPRPRTARRPSKLIDIFFRLLVPVKRNAYAV